MRSKVALISIALFLRYSILYSLHPCGMPNETEDFTWIPMALPAGIEGSIDCVTKSASIVYSERGGHNEANWW